jgi:hypothetical protein
MTAGNLTRLIVVAAIFVLFSPPLPAAPTEPAAVGHPLRPAQVERFIGDVVAALYTAQNAHGHWDSKDADPNADDRNFAGTTSLCVYALLAAGESPQNPKLKPAINWLKKARISGTYIAGVRLNAWAYLSAAAIRDEARSDQQFLIRGQIPPLDPQTRQPCPAAGLYDYTDNPAFSRFDHSVSQYGVLGMWAADQMGLPAPQGYWRAVELAWLRDQHADGGWSYNGSGKSGMSTVSMTAAGVATLFVAQDFVRGQLSGVPGKGNLPNEPIDRGLAWLGANFSPEQRGRAGPDDSLFYRLYAVERVGLASGLKDFGSHNWFEEGVQALAGEHYTDGKFVLRGKDENNIRDLAFTLLFLARGHKPVLINKLKYPGDWNERPRDIANLVRQYSKYYETELLWQIVSLENDPRGFHEAAFLYMSGFGPLDLQPVHKARLKQYIEDGGMIVANADGQDPQFTASFKKLVEEMFPQYPLRPLPPEHLINSANLRLTKPIAILGQSNGIRELCLLLSEQDPPRAWQVARPRENQDLFDVATNIIFYASDKDRLHTRGVSHIILPDASIVPTRRMTLARIQYNGNWDPEPGGWRRMAAILHNQNKVELEVTPVALSDGKLVGRNFAHLTGTAGFTFTPEQLRELRSFIAAGGTLIVDAGGGSAQFADSAEQQLAGIVTGGAMETLVRDDPLFADTHPLPESSIALFGDAPAEASSPKPDQPLDIAFRRFAKARRGGINRPQLMGVRVGKRWAIIYSPYDISAGLVGRNVDGVNGYTPASATEIVRRILANAGPKGE